MSPTIDELRLYEMLKLKIGEREAEAFVHILDARVENKFQEKTGILATKEDIAKDIGRLELKITETKVDIIRWIIGTAIAGIGLAAALLKLL